MKTQFEKLADMADAEIAKKDREERARNGQEEFMRQQFEDIYSGIKFLEELGDVAGLRGASRFFKMEREEGNNEITISHVTKYNYQGGPNESSVRDGLKILTYKSPDDRESIHIRKNTKSSEEEIAKFKHPQNIIKFVMQWVVKVDPELCQNARKFADKKNTDQKRVPR